MEHINTFRTLSWRRKALAFALTGLLAVTGVASFAAISDTLTQTNNYSVLSITLEGSNDGTTYTASITQDWAINPAAGSMIAKPLHLKNTGNGTATITFVSSATGATSITGGKWEAIPLAVGGVCTTNPAGSAINGTTQTLANATYTGTALTLAPGESKLICQRYTTPTGGAVDGAIATQTITWTATGGL